MRDGQWAETTVLPEPQSTVTIDCPYCGETVEILIEEDLAGEMVHDCEVCCHPWRLTVRRQGQERRIEAARLDD